MKAWRSEKYRRFVASLPCFGCGIEGYSQCAHPNYGRGLGQKSDDSLCFPLCAPRLGTPGCHYQLDNLIDMTRDQRREMEAKYSDRMRNIASLGGWWKSAA